MDCVCVSRWATHRRQSQPVMWHRQQLHRPVTLVQHSATCTGVSLSHTRLPVQVCHYLTLGYLHRCVIILHSSTCTGVSLSHTRLPVQVCLYLTLGYLHRCVIISHSSTCTGVSLSHTRLLAQMCLYLTLGYLYRCAIISHSSTCTGVLLCHSSLTLICVFVVTQTMSHIVESCLLTKLNGGSSRLHSVDEDTVSFLTNYCS